jgi:hypothetical protein
MNSRSITIGLLAVNLALVGIVVYMVFLLRVSPTPTRFLSKTRVVTNTVTQIAVRKLNTTNLLNALASRALNWAAIESTNYYVYIANLRAIGCPEETIKDIIITDVAKLYGKRRAELRSHGEPYQFWRTDDSWEGSIPANPQLQHQLAALDNEQRALVKELLGADLQTELKKYLHSDDYDERMYAFLPAEKREKLKEVQSRYDELEQEIYARAKGLILDEDQEQLKRIQAEREQELAKLLSPEEMEEYELRNSPTAHGLRSQLSGFDPNEEEFRKIFRLQKVFDAQFANAFNATDEVQMELRARAQEEAQDALNEEIKKLIGTKRFADYERAQDADYKALVQFTDRFEMPRDVAVKVYDMKLEAERQKLRIEANPNLTEEQRQAALMGIVRETQRSVTQALGDRGQSYLRTGGQWIRDLADSPSNATIENGQSQ